MAKGKRVGKAHSAGYARYKSSGCEATNRKRKLEKTAREQPNNEQIPLAIKNIHHRRGTPVTPFWSSSMIRMAKVIKEFTGVFNKNYFSTDPDLYNAAVHSRNVNKFTQYKMRTVKGSMYSIGERIGWKF